MRSILLLGLSLLIEVSGQHSLKDDWDVRLAGGPNGFEGRLEIRPPRDVWGTVCDRNRTALARACRGSVALSVCRRLGYLAPYSLRWAGRGFCGDDLPIWSQGFSCRGEPGNPGITVPCSLTTWSRHQSSCDHRSDVALICISDKLRLAGGCSPREGRAELDMGSAGWVGFSRRPQEQLQPGESTFIAELNEADLICKHLGYPIALGLQGACTSPAADPALLTIAMETCGSGQQSLSMCLRSMLTRGCETETHNGKPREAVCAYVCEDASATRRYPACEVLESDILTIGSHTDSEVVVSANSVLHGLDFDVHLVGGPLHLVGLLEVRYNGSDWGPVCLHKQPVLAVDVLAKEVCGRIGLGCYIDFNLVPPANDSSLGGRAEYLLREELSNGKRHWLRLNDRCRRLGGRYLRISCSLEITVQGVTVSIFPNQTCIGRCGERSSPVKCGCDAMCQTFQDCCYDAAHECSASSEPEGEVGGTANQTARDLGLVTTLVESSQFYECLPLSPTPASAYHLVSRCPDSWAGGDVIVSRCHLPGLASVRPVIHTALGVPFKNAECAYCHGAAVPPADGTGDVAVPPGDSLLVPIPASAYSSTLRPCTSLVSTCHPREPPWLASDRACPAYMAPYKTYKNPHCGLCNVHAGYIGVCYKYVEINTLQLLLRVDMPMTSPVEPQPVYHPSERVDPQRIRQDRHETSLAVTPKAGAAQEPSRGTASRKGSAACLLNRIAFSDLQLALHFPSPIEDWDLNRETGAVVTATSSLEHADQLEEELDNILIPDGDHAGIRWSNRCGLAQVLVSRKSVLGDPAQAAHRSSNDSMECFQTGQISTLVNISDQIFVYIVPFGALIRPANATSTIRYDLLAERTDKSKFFEYCGTRENNITCETWADEDGSDPGLAAATLPSGEKLVCISHNLIPAPWDGVSFDDPTQVLNVVGFSLSMTGLVATLVTYSVFPTLRNVPGLAIMSLSLAILAGQLSAILSTVVVDPANAAACTAVAVISHYVWLAAFAWMAAMSWDLMRTFTGPAMSATASESRVRFLRLSVFGWGAPLLVVIPQLALHFCDCTRLVFRYGGRWSCWLAGRGSSLLMFCVPILLCVCFNVGCFAWTIRGIRASKRASAMVHRNTSRVRAVWKELVVYAKISSLMSFAWILGFAAIATELAVFGYLFVILCSLQGVFVFLAFAFSSQVRALWRAKLGRPAAGARAGRIRSGASTSVRDTPLSGATNVITGNTNTSV